MFFRTFKKFLTPLSIGTLCALTPANATPQPLVALTQIVQHPSLDAIRQGIVDELAAAGYTDKESVSLVYDNAQGNPALATQIAQKFVALAPTVIVAISTPSAQTALTASRDAGIPIVFGAVTDPVSAKLVQSLETTGGNITGTTDLPPCARQLALIKDVVPDVKAVGTVYNPGEANNVFQLGLLKKEAAKLGLEIVEKTISRSSDVTSATKALMGKVQAILLMNDNTVISALESVLVTSNTYDVPVFTSDPDSVKRGALAALANDQYDVGRATGKLVVRLLRGEKASTIPVKEVQAERLYVNIKAAKRLRLTLPDGIDVFATPPTKTP
ncbi:MAG: ABC transporter substrate-binding protein [Alphaproteobacteria bacterium]|nr:ABC transporter substrate-binding protein [Alphaproteobacteria bacterium]